MTTKAEAIAVFKAKYPTLRSGDEERGYTQLLSAEYDATISGWADAQVAAEVELAEVQALADNKASALAKLEALGLTTDDLKALGL